MRSLRTLLVPVALAAALTGCAPRQDPGVPIPPHAEPPPASPSEADALDRADRVIGRRADLVAGIDTARSAVADNLANAETPGYKAVTCRLIDGRPTVLLDTSEGSLSDTRRDLDVAIAGNGFFRVKVDPRSGDGFAYTRDGHLFRGRDGNLVVGLGDGHRLDPPINVPPTATDLSVSEDGIVSVRSSGQTAHQAVVGEIHLFRFVDAPSLRPLRASLYQSTDASGPATESRAGDDGAGRLEQGYLESSNVQVEREKLRTEYLERWRTSALISGNATRPPNTLP